MSCKYSDADGNCEMEDEESICIFEDDENPEDSCEWYVSIEDEGEE